MSVADLELIISDIFCRDSGAKTTPIKPESTTNADQLIDGD
jgi:hypothetical protein